MVTKWEVCWLCCLEIAVLYPLALWLICTNRKLTETRFKRFFVILGVGLIVSLFPFGLFSLMMGLPVVLIGALVIRLLLDKEAESGTHGN